MNYYKIILKNHSKIREKIGRNFTELEILTDEKRFINPFFKEIILEYGFDYFKKQIFPNLTNIQSCSIIDTYGDSVNCQNNSDIIFAINDNIIQIFHYLKNQLIFAKIKPNNIAKIVMQFNVDDCWKPTILLHENSKKKYHWTINTGLEIDVKFQSILLQKSLTSYKETCVVLNKNSTYSKYLGDCRNKLFIDILLNKWKFDCLPRNIPSIHLDDLKLFGNKFCKEDKLLSKNHLTYYSEMIPKVCPLPCSIEFVSADVIEKPLTDLIRVNFIPKSNPKPIFTYYLSMDFNNFIYDVGGNIGMWIGYSAITPSLYLYEISKNLSYQQIQIYFFRIINLIVIKLTIIKVKSILFFKYIFHQLKMFINIIWSFCKLIFLNIFRKFKTRVHP